MKGYSFRSLTDLVLKIFKTKVNAGTGLSGGGSLEADRTLTVKYGTVEGTAAEGNDSRLSDSREWIAATISQAEAEAGIATTRRAFTAQRIRQATVAWWNNITSAFGRDLVTSATNTVARDKLGLHISSLRWPKWDEVTDKPLAQTTGQSTSSIMSQKAISDAIREVWPVGVCYTQYPHTPTPATLFGGTWKLLFANEGTFFRTEGGGALAFDAGWQGDAFKVHSHSASSGQAGGHSHIGTAATAGSHTHSGSTSSAGNHSHSGSANAAGNHSHTRGTMNITGTFAGYTVYGSNVSGAFTSNDGTYQGPSSIDNSNEGQNTTTLDASRTWSGNTSATGNHSHTLTVNANGDHSHTITAAAAGNHSHTVTTDTANNHVHTITIANTGDTETRPRNRTIRVWQRTA